MFEFLCTDPLVPGGRGSLGGSLPGSHPGTMVREGKATPVATLTSAAAGTVCYLYITWM